MIFPGVSVAPGSCRSYVWAIAEVGPDLDFRSRLRQILGFSFGPDPYPESKIWEKPEPEPELLFNFDCSRSLCDHFLSKNIGKLRWIDNCSRSLNRSRILKFEKLPDRIRIQKFWNRSGVGV